MSIQGFKRGGDPYDKLGIGPKSIIDNWFKKWVLNNDYEIDDDLNITVNGSLWLSYFMITSLPDNLTVGGALDLYKSNITMLLDNLTVGEWLNLEGSKITKLPDSLKVKGKIWKDF